MAIACHFVSGNNIEYVYYEADFPQNLSQKKLHGNGKLIN